MLWWPQPAHLLWLVNCQAGAGVRPGPWSVVTTQGGVAVSAPGRCFLIYLMMRQVRSGEAPRLVHWPWQTRARPNHFHLSDSRSGLSWPLHFTRDSISQPAVSQHTPPCPGHLVSTQCKNICIISKNIYNCDGSILKLWRWCGCCSNWNNFECKNWLFIQSLTN